MVFAPEFLPRHQTGGAGFPCSSARTLLGGPVRRRLEEAPARARVLRRDALPPRVNHDLSGRQLIKGVDMATPRRWWPKCALLGAALVLLGSCDRAPTDGSVSGALPHPNFAVGDVTSVQPLPIPGQDVSVAFDGKKIYYSINGDTRLISFTPGNPPTNVTTVTVADALGNRIDLDAMAYDGTRDMIWAVQHATENIYLVNKMTGLATFQFSATGKCARCIGTFKDGLAFDAGNVLDASDDALWWSYDVDWVVYKLKIPLGTEIEHFDVRGPDGIAGTADDIHPDLSRFGNSGIAVGGSNLYLGTDGGGSIIRVDKVTKKFVDVLATPGQRPEDMECDPVTFAPKEVMWVRQFEDPNNVRAVEIEPNTCGLGGGAPQPATLTLEPPAAENPVGTQHCVTATVKDVSGNPVPNVTVVFTVTGSVNTGGSVPTDANGQAKFCYMGPTQVGADVISAFADANNNGRQDPGEPSGKATKAWVAGAPATLVLTPPAATNTVGAKHCVTATVRDAFGNPVSGVTVVFSVGPSVPTTFPRPPGGTATTDANGQATFCYTASLPGVDRIHAFADVNSSGREDPGEPFGDAEKTWIPPTSTQLCEVTITDGGWIIANNMDRANFGGNAKVLPDGTVQGQQEYQDQGPAQPMNVHSTEITATTCSDDLTMASIFGKATIDGAGSHVFRIDVTDGGSGGSNDSYGIMLDTGYLSGQHPLSGGNVTIHKQ
ncbi:MAG: hypothetical protein DMD66_01280 [Gemmatimonadetes bacterium]|nr:MAG: hypothetical protein DMD66_01280 [Gemmatimonadota bacterium]